MDDSSQPKADNNIENQLREVETKLVEMENNWKRALADYKNLEKRVIDCMVRSLRCQQLLVF